MRKIIALAVLVLPMSFAAHAADSQLFHISVAEKPVENGKVLNIDFQETKRHASDPHRMQEEM